MASTTEVDRATARATWAMQEERERDQDVRQYTDGDWCWWCRTFHDGQEG